MYEYRCRNGAGIMYELHTFHRFSPLLTTSRGTCLWGLKGSTRYYWFLQYNGFEIPVEVVGGSPTGGISMLAVYARKSVDRQDSISTESQIDFCKYETKGERFETYVDRGFSGKNTDRPAFQRLLEDIKNGKISKVIVYKLDRISRSILDFSNIMDMFQKYNVEFVSSTEKFDTPTPMGRAMLNICIVFAQLERETIQKRVIDTYISRSQRGFFMGGGVSYGFRLVNTTIQGVKTSMYAQEPEEAEQIRLMYQMYQNPNVSYGDIKRHFDEHGILSRGQKFSRDRFPQYLSNPAYVMADKSVYEFYKNRGIRIINDETDFTGTNGCYYYAGQEENGAYLVIAPYVGLIPSDVWLKCAIKRMQNKQIQPGRKVSNTWLAGKIKCGVCGYALSKKLEKPGKKYAYYRCTRKMKANDCASSGMIKAEKLENDIYLKIVRKLEEFETLSASNHVTTNPKLAKLQAELAEIEQAIENHINSISSFEPAVLAYINEKVKALDGKKNELVKAIREMSVSVLEVGQISILKGYLAKWQDLSMDDKRQVCNLLIKTIRATSKEVTIDWNF